jgi:hypothetical protein
MSEQALSMSQCSALTRGPMTKNHRRLALGLRSFDFERVETTSRLESWKRASHNLSEHGGRTMTMTRCRSNNAIVNARTFVADDLGSLGRYRRMIEENNKTVEKSLAVIDWSLDAIGLLDRLQGQWRSSGGDLQGKRVH